MWNKHDRDEQPFANGRFYSLRVSVPTEDKIQKLLGKIVSGTKTNNMFITWMLHVICYADVDKGT